MFVSVRMTFRVFCSHDALWHSSPVDLVNGKIQLASGFPFLDLFVMPISFDAAFFYTNYSASLFNCQPSLLIA